jgi:ABC-type sugar transport system ATPase subunit
VFLLDEPLSNLDANLRVSMRQELRRIHEIVGATFVYVTHDQDDALAMGDRVLVLADGKLQQYDAAARVYHYPANRFVAAFLGRLPMNFFNGSLETRGDALVFRNEYVTVPVPYNASMAARTATLGVRPDAVTARSDRGDLLAATGTVRWLEVVQPDLYATIQVGDHSVIARVPDDQRLEVGQTAGLAFAPTKLHLFDPTTGARLNPAPAEASGQATGEATG